MHSRLVIGLITLTSGGFLHAAGVTGNSAQEIQVLGSDLSLTGTPLTATEGVVWSRQLQTRPVSRTAELLEFVPGLMATQHSGEGKANQYFMRGFNLDHGTDLALRVEGMPVNMPSHGHGHGYADLNFLIPELLSSLRYRKGPYYASAGDFAAAGSVDFEYAGRLADGNVSLTAGQHDYRRIFAANTFGSGRGAVTLAGALTRYDGPWDLDQDLDKKQALARYNHQDPQNHWNLTAMLYDNSWAATDQIPQRAVDSDEISRWGTIDPSSGGETHRHSLSFDWRHDAGNDRGWSLNSYIIDYELDLYSNFTYFLDNPIQGDQFHQQDSRTVLGGNGEYHIPLALGITDAELRMGAQFRYDDIDLGLHSSQSQQRLETIREDGVSQSLSSFYTALEQRWSNELRSELSLRMDHYRYDVNAGIAANSGTDNETLLSPSVNMIYSSRPYMEYFLSVGRGFHSNDARGATMTVDPESGEPADAVDPLVSAESLELGMRSSWLPNTQIAVSTFLMELDSELIYEGDEGVTEPVDGSRRFGVELGAIYSPTNWLLIDGDLALTRARLRNTDNDADRIPNSVSRVASLGFTVDSDYGFDAGIRLRYLGEAPLTESGIQRSDSTFLVNAQGSYQMTPALNLSLTLINALDRRDNDITYFYESRLPGEAAPVEDFHFRPVEPRMLRLTLQASF